MTVAGELINILGFKLEGEGNLKKFNQGMDNAEAGAKKSSDRIRKLGVAAGIATTAAIGMGVAAVKNSAAFERQMTRIGITAGASKDAVLAATESVKKYASDFALPIDQAVAGLDTLTASGQDLETAMAFLPSVLATAQASGAATEDIANTALKAASAFQIAGKDMQNAFDIMVAGGKAGQFELKDMATYIPGLANTFANMGYKGEEGLQKLVAILQTIRTTTGDASTAGTNAANVFGNMLSPATVKNFKDMGTDIKAELDKATASGEDLMRAYARISNETMKNNPGAALTELFSDKQLREGMLALMTLGDKWTEFDNAVSNSDVSGSVLRDLGTVLSDTQTRIDRLGTSWDGFMKSLGASISGPLGTGLDAATNYLEYDAAVAKSNHEDGRDWRLFYGAGEKDQLARRGGYAPTATDREIKKNAPRAYEVLGRYPQRPNSTVGTGKPKEPMDLSSSGDSQAIYNMIAGMNANLADMSSGAAAGAVITDSRQDNRSFPVTVQAPVNVNVTQAVDAPGKVGAAISGAIGKAATDQASRIESEPSQP